MQEKKAVSGASTTMDPENARALLQTTQSLRTHWSSSIVTLIGYAVVLNVAIWSYFLKAYVDSLTPSAYEQPLFIGVASAISSIVIMLWRLYTRYIDNHIAGLYSDFLLCEGVLSIPTNSGTSGYLMRAVPIVNRFLADNNLTREQKLKGISSLISSKRIGRRGHFWFDVCSLVLILIMAVVSAVVLRNQFQQLIAIACFVGIGASFILTLFEFFFYQREPSKKLVDGMIVELKETTPQS